MGTAAAVVGQTTAAPTSLARVTQSENNMATSTMLLITTPTHGVLPTIPTVGTAKISGTTKANIAARPTTASPPTTANAETQPMSRTAHPPHGTTTM